jgi:hypothetical protein
MFVVAEAIERMPPRIGPMQGVHPAPKAMPTRTLPR